MYDPGSDQWTTVGSLPKEKTTSDLAAWSWQNYIYIAGGYFEDYTATTETIRLDMNQFADNYTASSDTIDYETMYPMAAPRGDFHAVTYFGYAYAAGGITHTSNWCTSLTDFERYHMATDTWETLDDLTVGRADMAVAVLNGKIVATGGEVKPLNCETLLDPAFGSLPQDDVEVFIPSIGDSKAEWVSYMASPRELFRYAAAAVPAMGAIYTFGGQKPYDASCQCFASSDEILMAREAFRSSADSTSASATSTGGSVSGGTAAGIAIGCSILSLALGLIIGRFLFSNLKSSSSGVLAESRPNINETASEADSSVNPKLA